MKKLNLFLISFFYILNGIFHFMFTESYLPIMPDFLPFHWELILISGVLEFLFGIGVIFEKYRNIALSGIIVILILFMSVHLNMLIPENSLGYSYSLLTIRALFQFVLIYWAWMNRLKTTAI
jgi:uncharacterized membrane protein